MTITLNTLKDKTTSVLDAFSIQEESSIGIQGAGGKTSLLLAIAKVIEFENTFFSTTTKMNYPNNDLFDCIVYDEYIDSLPLGTTFYAKRFNNEKCSAPKDEDLKRLSSKANVSVFEIDGSNHKSLKGYREDEPVGKSFMNSYIAVLNIRDIGKRINEETVHRVNVFCEQTSSIVDTTINVDTYVRYLSYKQGVLKNQPILFFNQIECEEDYNVVKEILSQLDSNLKKSLPGVVVGSVKENYFVKLQEGEYI